MGFQNHEQYSQTLMKNLQIESLEEISEQIEFVRQKDVRYLALEGGGGKGVVLLGAVAELEKLGILQHDGNRLSQANQIKGIAGSSAGALMAVMLSMGYKHSELVSLVKDYNLNRFLDLPYRKARKPSVLGAKIVPLRLNGFLKQVYRIWGIHGSQEDDVKKKLRKNILRYISNLFQHLGIFAGYEPIRFFNDKIAERAALVEGKPKIEYDFLTFKRHKKVFKIDLVITGSNFETGKSELFSAETTPDWPVCIAAANTMRIPIIYKPMYVNESEAHKLTKPFKSHERMLSPSRAQGYWVDGGYFNNLPIFAFAHKTGAIKQTLGISISGEKAHDRKVIKNFWSFLGAYAQLGLFGGGEAHVTATTGVEPNRIDLKAFNKKGEIELTDFRPKEELVKSLQKAAAESVRNYFNQ